MNPGPQTDQTYAKLKNRWKETMDLPTQTVGPLTPLYKSVTGRLKTMPWPVLALAAGCVVAGLFLVFGSPLVRLVSLLQRGF